MLQHLICPLASADRSREPVWSKPASQIPTKGKDYHPQYFKDLGEAGPVEVEQGSGTRHDAEMALNTGTGKAVAAKP